MALTTTDAGHAPLSISSIFSALGRALIRAAENNPRMKQVARLNETSDAELAEQGLSREEVLHHIFRDRYYI